MLQDPNAFKWTSKYLQTNNKMAAAVTTLLELAFMPPHAALHAGKVTVAIASECTHDRMTALLGASSADAGGGLRDKLQVGLTRLDVGLSCDGCTMT
jgi:hypothetical protein